MKTSLLSICHEKSEDWAIQQPLEKVLLKGKEDPKYEVQTVLMKSLHLSVLSNSILLTLCEVFDLLFGHL
jgi:hypothetical protein